MFTIGDFASIGRVSVRMLRHYDSVGLLHPARVDEYSGYRYYRADQLATLNRIIALKDLGFTLAQIGPVLAEQVGAAQLRGMLTLRHAELHERINADAARLARIEARLRVIESEGLMPDLDVIVKPVAAQRVAQLTDTAAGFDPSVIGPVVQPLCARLGTELARCGLTPAGSLIAHYEQAADGSVLVHAAIPVAGEPSTTNTDLSIVELPALDAAATLVHHGPMSEVLPDHQALARWVEDNSYVPSALGREVYLDCPSADQSDWVTELQIPVHPA